MKITHALEKLSEPFWAVVGLVFVVLVGIINYLAGYEVEFSLFFLIPISLVTWFASTRLAIAISIISAIAWYTADVASGDPIAPSILYWNTGIRFSFFVIVMALLSALRANLKRAEKLSRVDHLTGAVNLRYFSELAQAEISRAQRYNYHFTVAYIDLDNFKRVNDQYGHRIGDEVLRIVVNTAKIQLRSTDVVARIGGDEFTLLLPETEHDGACALITKLQQSVLTEMQNNGWPVTLSIGVLTCIAIPHTADELIKMADDLMYSAKNSGKNAISASVYTG